MAKFVVLRIFPSEWRSALVVFEEGTGEFDGT